MRRTSQKDIARELNLSQAFVGKVLAGRPGTNVSEQTRRRILETAERLNYRPNASARSLRNGRTMQIALVYHFNLDYLHLHGLFAELAEAMAAELSRHGYDLILKAFAAHQELEEYGLDALASRACDGIVLWGAQEYVRAQSEILSAAGSPFVAVGRFEADRPAWPQIDFDHEGMMRQCVQALAERGHRRIAFLGIADDQAYTACLRRGYLDAMAALPGGGPPLSGGLPEGEQVAAMEASLSEWLAWPEDRRPTALVVGTGSVPIWRSLEESLARRGLSVGFGPGQIALAGAAPESRPFVLGRALIYGPEEISFAWEGHELIRHLLLPQLRGEPLADPVLRLLPHLVESAPRWSPGYRPFV